ncbi:hypothetical protein IW261DRAFT_1424755 [Armillaria novae-zelandiae]|uniref:Uncharacterized protein n=1 Tax=Armillaria novae-zelandiae TaxID=153914 RepID=A0AA39T8P8_9AGAR|nr:hypothetical protein IW261DRAFT_1424755 [Armillaria novae-zelandiae]
MLQSQCLKQSVEFQIGTDVFANGIAVQFLPLILLLLSSNTVLNATYFSIHKNSSMRNSLFLKVEAPRRAADLIYREELSVWRWFMWQEQDVLIDLQAGNDLVDLHSMTFYIIMLKFLGRPGLVTANSSQGARSAAMAIWKGQARVLAQGYVLTSGEQGHVIVIMGSANDRLHLAFALQLFEMLSTSWTHNHCLDTMYRCPVKEGMALLKWWGVIQMVPLKCGVHNTALVVHRLSRHRTDHGQRLLHRHDVSTSGKQGHGVVKAAGCLVEVRGLKRISSEGTASSRLKAAGCLVEVWCLQTIALPWSRIAPRLFKTYNTQWTMTLTSKRHIDVLQARTWHRQGGRCSLGLALPLNDFCLDTTFHPSMTQDVQHVFSGNNFCLDMMYRRPPWSCIVPQLFKTYNAQWTTTVASTRCIDVQRPWSRSPPQQLLPRHDVLMSSKQGHSIVEVADSYANHVAVWLKNGSLVMVMICDLQRCINVQGAPKRDGEKYGMARKDNEMRDQLKKGVDHPTRLPTPV